MKKIIYLFFVGTMAMACSPTTPADTNEMLNKDTAAVTTKDTTTKDTITSSKEKWTVIGAWYTEEVIRGQDLVFSEDGSYVAYSGGTETKDKWEIVDNKIKLGEGEALPFELKEGVLIIDGMTYQKTEK